LRFIIKKGRVYQEVVSQAKSYTESLIIASTHGASGFEEVFIGSNAQKIVFESDRPVITIRRDPVPENIKNIILPLDIIMDSRQKVPYTAELAQAFNAKIHVLPISQSKRNVSKITGYVKQVCAYLDSKNIPYESKFMYGKDPAESIIDYAISTNAELISIINEEGPSFTKSLGSIFSKYTQLMINKSPVPVLNYKPKSIFIKGSFN
jgi:nucleotide-binding universal stress UspA family protein